MTHLVVSDPVHLVMRGRAVGGSVCRGRGVQLGRETLLRCSGVAVLLPLRGDEVLPLHGGGGQAGGLAALVLRLLCQLGEVLPLSLRPLLVSLGTTKYQLSSSKNSRKKDLVLEKDVKCWGLGRG